MKKKRVFRLFLCLLLIFMYVQTVAAEELVIVDFYYSQTCGSCRPAKESVEAVIDHYFGDTLTPYLVINIKEVSTNSTYRREMTSRKLSYPSVIINNETRIPKNNITYDNLVRIIDSYLANITVDEPYDPMVVDIPFVGRVNLSQLSLPMLTIVLGGLDSFNPCSFFILIFLMNLLLYLRSRRRMALVGGIFIFFSGFFYFMFMFILANTMFFTRQHIDVISLLAGGVALAIGLLNIKDFFLPKKGPSLSIPEQKRPTIFKKMRSLVHTSSLPAVIAGTIVLAITVNFYELLCTFGFPFVFTTALAASEVSLMEYYSYIFFYNVVYVIPLIVIVCIFVLTLGKMKLSQWQGQQLKLLSGFMMFSFGVVFLLDYQLLEQFTTPIALLGLSIALTLVVSFFWGRKQQRPKNDSAEREPDSEEKK